MIYNFVMYIYYNDDKEIMFYLFNMVILGIIYKYFV